MQVIDRVNRAPRHLRQPTARQVGDRLSVTNQERECLKLKTIKPVDMTDKQLADFRKVKHRAKMQRLRRTEGRKPRSDYLANSLTKQKPWKAEGISRAQWYRKRAKINEMVRKVAKVRQVCAKST